MFIQALFFLIGAALVVTPWWPGLMPGISLTSRIVMMISGVTVLLLVAVVTTISRLYRKTSANMAFVRTGMGGTLRKDYSEVLRESAPELPTGCADPCG